MTTVTAAVIERGGRILVCRRRAEQDHGGKWEFPGGKLEQGESPEDSLQRELREELRIEARIESEIARYEYQYPGREPLRLIFFRVAEFSGEPDYAHFAEVCWARPEALTSFDFLEGDVEFVRALAAGAFGAGLGAAGGSGLEASLFMTRTIQRASSIFGTVRLPGDKSISHRYAMLAAVARGRTVIDNYSTGADCASTLACLRDLGVAIDHEGNRVTIEGVGFDGLNAPAAPLDAGNSGSTIRMLSGILAGQEMEVTIGGDESLSRRPMGRIIMPLAAMGAGIAAAEGDRPPLRIRGGPLRAIQYELEVASAQVKTAVLFAGLFADGMTSVHEALATRNHSEIALREFGADVTVDGLEVGIEGGAGLRGLDLRVPGDLSSAAFFLAAGLLLPGSDLIVEQVGLNPTRTALLDVLRTMGADIEVLSSRVEHGEPVGSLRVAGGARDGPVIEGGVIEGATTAAVIDEIPILAVLGAVSRQGLDIRDAAELRVKETDRIATVAENLRRMGVPVEVRDDGMTIPGGQTFRGAELDSFGDHRVAMAFTVAGLAAKGPCEMRGAEAASVSFPEFYDLLGGMVRS